MKIKLYHGDILELRVDVLVCSANVSLNLSGGVGGALLTKYGSHLQSDLHSHLPATAPRFAKRGDVVVTHPKNTPYKAVLHAVAIDAFYDSSSGIIADICRKAFHLAAAEQAASVALAALATGFGHLSVPEFAKGLNEVISEDFTHIAEVIIAVQSEVAFEELKNSFPRAEIVEHTHTGYSH